jgi:molybdopterin-guanine dinucleotide biosynthesis protein A
MPTIQAAGFVLAGGRSSRMGTNKALLILNGETLIERALRKLRAVCPEVAIAGGTPELARFAPILPDEFPDRGPLGGIIAALEHSSHEWNLILAVDVPFLPIEVLERLLACTDEHHVCIMAEVAGQKHPLCAAYSRRSLATLRAELARGNGKVTTAIAAAGQVLYLPFEHEAWFQNLNTPEDFTQAMKLKTDQP